MNSIAKKLTPAIISLSSLQFIIGLLAVFMLYGCKPLASLKRELKKVEEISSISPDRKYIKVHMNNGNVYVLHDWLHDNENKIISGYGTHLDINRQTIDRGPSAASRSNELKHEIPYADISLIETNKRPRGVSTGLVIAGVVVGVVAAICIIDPKACFGSCPTFYTVENENRQLVAEGFSSSVAPALEKKDIDMLYTAQYEKDFELIVTNEALETHYIRHANILAVEKKEEERIYVTPDGSFVRGVNMLSPKTCESDQGSCEFQVKQLDQDEYYSLADAEDLNTKEEIFVSFEVNDDSDLGLVIAKRQTLLTTFLLYQSLAYMGKGVSYFMTELDRKNMDFDSGVFDLLGGIEIYQKDVNGIWRLEGEVNETGPIATDVNIIPLSNNGISRDKVELKIKMNKGLWRIDYLGLTSIIGDAEASTIQPYFVDNISGSEENALAKLNDESDMLVTFPGDEYQLKYKLPFDHAELFLESKGFYIEWMREEWIKEQNLSMVKMMLRNPSKYLKELAGPFKQSESNMENVFWNSRYEN